MQSELDSQYCISAKEKLQNGDFAACLILLQHISSLTLDVAKLITESAYKLWKYSFDLNKRDQHKKLVLDGYTRVLDSGIHQFMHPLDYINLSTIYISEGALDGGLRILQLASARGHFEDIVIVFCIWIVLKQFDDRIDLADAQQNFIVSALVQSHVKPENVNIAGMKLEFIMMHSANYLRNKFLLVTREKLKKPSYEKFRAVVTELFILVTKTTPQSMQEILAWFDDPVLWMNAGMDILETPFGILVSEEFFWQAFLRKPLDPAPLDLMLSSIKRYHREDCTRSVLEKAIKISPWHLGCRDGLKAIDINEEVPYMLSWVRVFDAQELKLCKIQSWVRGVLTRIWWKTGRVDIILRKQQALKKLNRSGKAFLIQRDRRKLQLFRQWQMFIFEWKKLKQQSALRIQVFWRKIWAEYCFSWAKYRIRRANCLFLVVCQHHVNTKGMRIFRAWQDIAQASKLRRSANTIIEQLRADQNFQIFHKYVTLLMQLKKIRRQIYNRTCFGDWMKIYRGRVKKHAMMSIRFYVRNNYKTKGLPKKETKAQLEQRMQAMEAIVSKTITLNPINKLRMAWKTWCKELQKILCARAKQFVASRLPLLWRRVKARTVVKVKRVKFEVVDAGYLVIQRKRIRVVYFFIRKYTCILRLQRFIRCSLAKLTFWRLKDRQFIVDSKFSAACKVKLGIMIRRWRKAAYLFHREKLGARFRIKRCFHLAKCKRLLTASMGKKSLNGRLLMSLHRKHLKKVFRTLKMNTIIQFQIDKLIPFCSALTRFHLRHSMKKWCQLLRDQTKLSKLLCVSLKHIIDRVYWKDAHVSVAEVSVVDRQQDWRAAFMNKTVTDPNAIYLDWERVVKPSLRLFSLRQMRKIRVWKWWMAAYRQRCRDRRCGSKVLVDAVVPFIMAEVWHRIHCRVIMQCAVRCSVAKERFRRKKKLFRIAEERYRSKHICNVKELLLQLRQFTVDCARSRLILQCSWRVWSSIRRVAILRANARKCSNAFQCLQRSQYRRALTRQVFACWVSLLAKRQSQAVNSAFGGVTAVPSNFSAVNASMSYSPVALVNKIQDLMSNLDFTFERFSELGASTGKVAAASNQSKLSSASISTKNEKRESPFKKIDSSVSNPKRKAIIAESNRLRQLQIKKDMQTLFQSQVFNAKLFQLRQTGVFVFDGVSAGAQDQHQPIFVQDVGLQHEEILFLVSNCETLFFQNMSENQIVGYLEYFNGSKVIFCGGNLKFDDGFHLLRILSARDCSRLSVQFDSIKVAIGVVYQLIAMLNGFIVGFGGKSLNLKELYVDCNSLGCIGTGVFLCSLKASAELRSLTISSSSSNWFAGFSVCIQELALATGVQELRFLGAPMKDKELFDLLSAIDSNGFAQLKVLEFVVCGCDDMARISDQIISSAKLRRISVFIRTAH